MKKLLLSFAILAAFLLLWELLTSLPPKYVFYFFGLAFAFPFCFLIASIIIDSSDNTNNHD